MSSTLPRAPNPARFMGREMCRERPLIVPMNLREWASVEATRSVTAVSFGAFVPVGKNGSGARHVNCLVTPVRVFPLGSFAFFCVRTGRVASSLNCTLEQPAKVTGRGFCCLRSQANSELLLRLNDLSLSRFMGSHNGQVIGSTGLGNPA